MKKILIGISFLISLSSALWAFTMPNESILFSGKKNNQWDLYLWTKNGSDYKSIAITNNSEMEGNPVYWERNGIIIASCGKNEASKFGLVAYNLSGKKIWELTDEHGSIGWAVPSPRDNRILAVRELADGWTQPGIISYPDGKFIPFADKEAPGGQMAWLSSNKILLSRKTPTGFDIFERNLETEKETPVVQGGVNWQTIANKKGTLALFVRRVGNVSSIFKLFKTQDQKWDYSNVTNSRTYDWQPSLNDDSTYLIYQSLIQRNFKNLLINLKTGESKMLDIIGFKQIYHPSFIPRAAAKYILNKK